MDVKIKNKTEMKKQNFKSYNLQHELTIEM